MRQGTGLGEIKALANPGVVTLPQFYRELIWTIQKPHRKAIRCGTSQSSLQYLISRGFTSPSPLAMCPHCSFAWPADTLEFLRSNLSASPFGDGLLGLLHLTSCGIPLPVCRICLPRPFSTLLLGLALNLSSSLMALLIFHTKSQRGWCLTDPQEPYDFLAECHVWSRLLEAGCRLCWPQWRTRQAKPSQSIRD